MVFLLSGLGLHLLHLNGVGLSAGHVQLMVPHALQQDALVNTQPRRIEYEVLKIEKKRFNACF